MEEVDQQEFKVIKWTIENFSCWNSEIHGDTIESPEFLFDGDYQRLKLCPDDLSLSLGDNPPYTYSEDVPFIPSIRSYIYRRGYRGRRCYSFRGRRGRGRGERDYSNFEELVDKIRKNEPQYKDQLTVQWKAECDSFSTDYMRSAIEVYDSCLKIAGGEFSFTESETRVYISMITYPLNESKMGWINIYGFRDHRSQKIEMEIGPGESTNTLIITRMSVLNDEDVEIRTEVNEHVFRQPTNQRGKQTDDSQRKWTFSNLLTTQEILKEGFSLLLKVKIVPSSKCKHLSGNHSPYGKAITVYPTSSILYQTSSNQPEGVDSKGLQAFASKELGKSMNILTTEDAVLLYQTIPGLQIKCDNVTFSIQKNILSKDSPIFKSMVSSNMIDSSSGGMEITDLKPPTFTFFLTYLHTGTMGNLHQSDTALELYHAADKCELPSLKKECVDFLRANVSVSNVCDILSLANKHLYGELTKVSHNFILNNFKEVSRSEEWKKLVSNKPKLVAKTLTYFAENGLLISKSS